MLAKLLKRKESRQAMQELANSDPGLQPQPDQPQLQYRYQRPDLLGKVSLLKAFY